MDNRLQDLLERITEWREARLPNCKGRIPAEIWSEAVELAHSEGIAPISRALCLDYLRLSYIDHPKIGLNLRTRCCRECRIEWSLAVLYVKNNRFSDSGQHGKFQSGQLSNFSLEANEP